jgi:DNA mismatch repair protein MutS2
LAELHRQVEDNARHAREMGEATERLARRETEIESDAVRREQQRQREWEKRSESLIVDFEARAQVAMDRLAEAAEQRKATEQAQRVIAKTKREFREEASAAMSSATTAAKLPERLPIEEGARVRLKDVREVATVRRVLKSGMLEVEAGFLKMQVPREEVVEVVPAREERRLPNNVRLETGPRWDVSYRELNIIGQRAEEAIEQVDKFLDSAALASVDRVRIIHGHGMGVLKRAVGEFLGTNPHVSRFYPAPQSEGGAGATIVELRE